MTTRVLFVCTGNICRSPAAESMLRQLAADAGVTVETDSAGTKDWNTGSQPDWSMQAALERRGIRPTAGPARQVSDEDFARFHLVVATDESNRLRLLRRCPDALQDRIRLLLQFAPAFQWQDVPDPYGGPAEAFDATLELIDAGVRGLLDHLGNGA